MNYLYAIADTLPNEAWVGTGCVIMLGAWFITCRCIEYRAVKKELKRALTPVFHPRNVTFFDVLFIPLKIVACGEVVLDLRHRMGTTKERDYVYRRAVDSLQSTTVRDWLLPINNMPVQRVTGISRILAMFWPAIW